MSTVHKPGPDSGEATSASASACKFSVLGHSGARNGEGCAGCDEQHRYLIDKHIGAVVVDRDVKPDNARILDDALRAVDRVAHEKGLGLIEASEALTRVARITSKALRAYEAALSGSEGSGGK